MIKKLIVGIVISALFITVAWQIFVITGLLKDVKTLQDTPVEYTGDVDMQMVSHEAVLAVEQNTPVEDIGVIIAENVPIDPIKVALDMEYVEKAKNLNMKMIYVKGGSYHFGKDIDNEVTLDDFWIGECEVTQAQWEAIMGTNIHDQQEKSRKATGEARPLRGVGSNYPMYYVNYDEAKEFCKELSRITGLKYDLPTEAQWEYAASGGERPNNEYKYSGSDDLDEVAWYYDNSDESSQVVKSKAPNELGIYDMSGNLREWCKDWYSESFCPSGKNPEGPTTGTERVVRGGSWRWAGSECLVGCRDFERRKLDHKPTYSTSYIGFRVVCSW